MKIIVREVYSHIIIIITCYILHCNAILFYFSEHLFGIHGFRRRSLRADEQVKHHLNIGFHFLYFVRGTHRNKVGETIKLLGLLCKTLLINNHEIKRVKHGGNCTIVFDIKEQSILLNL
jgi:hypothetical protein